MASAASEGDAGSPTVPGRRVAGWAAAGFCALLVGVGIGRFAYTPLLPAHVAAGWLTPAEAAFVGSANLAGYLAGALCTPLVAARIPALASVRAAMILTALSFAACAVPLGVGWLLAWRFAAGVTGAVLMIATPPLVFGPTPSALRGRVAGAVFTGVGLGVMLSGSFVAGLADAGPRVAWLVLAGAATLLTLVSWPLWPSTAATAALPRAVPGPAPRRRMALLILAYGCDGMGFVPHSLFISDYVARGLGQGVAAGAQAWVWFGVGAACGSVVVGFVAGRTSFRTAFVLALAVKALAIALPLIDRSGLSIAASAALVGMLTPGMGAVASGVAAEVAGASGQAVAWRRMTTAFAVCQAGGAYGFSFLFGATGDYGLMFALGAGLLGTGTLLAALAARGPR